MRIKTRLFNQTLKIVDWWTEGLRQAQPPLEKLRSGKIIGHRGLFADPEIKENTLQAFQICMEHGLWGVELDIRSTRDSQLVVHHDARTGRVFSARQPLTLGEESFERIHKEFPLLPTLSEVVRLFGKKIHLMLELKEVYPKNSRPWITLREILDPLEPVKDFHILSIEPEFFLSHDWLPPEVFLPVAFFRPKAFADLARSHQWGGLTGHYLLLTERIKDELHASGLKVGTGFIPGKMGLCREFNRDIDWIFTNRPRELQALLQHMAGSSAKL